MTHDKKRILIVDDDLGAQIEEALGRMLQKEHGVVIVDIEQLNSRLRGAFVEAAPELAFPRRDVARKLKEMATQIVLPVVAPAPRKKQPKPLPRKKKKIINPRGQR